MRRKRVDYKFVKRKLRKIIKDKTVDIRIR